MMGDLPKKDGLIMMDDLPRLKRMVSLWQVTYSDARWWSYYDGWPTQKKWWSHYDGWPTQMKSGKWSHCYGWPTQMKDERWSHCYGWPTQMQGERWSHCYGWPTYMENKRRSHYNGWSTQMIECDLPGKKTWLEKSWQDKADKLGASWLQGWLEDSSWW